MWFWWLGVGGISGFLPVCSVIRGQRYKNWGLSTEEWFSEGFWWSEREREWVACETAFYQGKRGDDKRNENYCMKRKSNFPRLLEITWQFADFTRQNSDAVRRNTFLSAAFSPLNGNCDKSDGKLLIERCVERISLDLALWFDGLESFSRVLSFRCG